MELIVTPKKIPCVYMRGGTSKGLFFISDDLPQDPEQRNLLLLDIMGSPHPLQIDGVGGANTQSSKAAIVCRSHRDDADIDYLFAQVAVNEAIVDTHVNCGNILSAVAPFAIDEGLFPAQNGTTEVRVYNINTETIVHSVVQTPNRKVNYRGEQLLDGVPGMAAPIFLRFLNAEGAKTGHFFPTGKVSELINDISVSLVDYSVPMMLLEASSVGFKGNEAAEDIDKHLSILQKIENMRLQAGERMGLGDVSDKVIPKVALLSQPCSGGTINSRYLTPHYCHKSHAITGAMCLASACYVEGSLPARLLGGMLIESQQITIEHPAGKMDLNVLLAEGEVGKNIQGRKINTVAVVRTARRLFEGCVITK